MGLTTTFGHGEIISATSFNNTHSTVYAKALDNIDVLKKLNATVLHEVDATTMAGHSKLSGKNFDQIVFNFPHVGYVFGLKDKDMIRLNQDFVSGFFNNAGMILSVDGEVHIRHRWTSRV
ncbi:heavy metal-associated isoprenylated plant protein 41-like [Rutidosis leptorrhynchoides]|uniref:heavy metal-associated isoprenylated plant protein 41-like n=1 Tax=Rutidosis leptorrhynchoides TaxID=125765 RepID=UPI003A99348D